MLKFILARILASIPVLFGLSLVVFLILHLLPGDPAQAMSLSMGASTADITQLRAELRLDDPLVVQYLQYLSGLLRGDLGFSYLYRQPVTAKVASVLPHTFLLASLALMLAFFVGGISGILAASFQGKALDRLVTGVSVVGVAIPAWWLALLLTSLFGIRLGWLPTLGTGSTKALILPVVSLGWPLAAIQTRLLRASLREVYRSHHVLAARSRGFGWFRILIRNSLRTAYGPVVSMVGLQFGGVVAGAVAIEVIFGRPGLGSYLIESMQAKDVPAIQGIILVVAVTYLLVNLAVDVVRAILEPKVRSEWQAA
jgi:ABC-type dipeptide/oligopeptide/nickel transport system permease component